MNIRSRAASVLAGLSLVLVPLLAPSLGTSTGWLAPAAAQQNQGQKLLRISAIPDQKPEKLNRLYPLVAGELSRQLGVQVKYVPMVDYAAAVSAFRTGDLDLVWFGGLTGVQARLQKPGAQVIAQRDIDAAFHSVFIANSGSGIKPIRSVQGLSAFKGRRFTFGSETSTSGTLMPLFFLAKAGVKPADFAGGAPGYSGSHDTTIALVQSGSYEAGAVNERVWLDNLRDGKTNPAKVKVIWRTPPYHDYHWMAQPNLDQRFGKGFSRKLQSTILGWNSGDPQQKQILEIFGAKKFIKANAADYQQIEQIGRQVGKIR